MISEAPREWARRLTNSGQRASWNTNSLCGSGFACLLLLDKMSIPLHNTSHRYVPTTADLGLDGGKVAQRTYFAHSERFRSG